MEKGGTPNQVEGLNFGEWLQALTDCVCQSYGITQGKQTPRAVLERAWNHYGQDLTYEDWVEQEVASYYRGQLRWKQSLGTPSMPGTPWRSEAPSRDERQSQATSTQDAPGEDGASPKGGLEKKGQGKAQDGKAPDGEQGKGKTKAPEDDAPAKGDGPKGQGKEEVVAKGDGPKGKGKEEVVAKGKGQEKKR